MGDPRGFLNHERQLPERRSIPVRIRDWKEVNNPFPISDLQHQASRCMDCGIPFCNHGCPLGNLIPDWNDLIYREQWQEASERLHATNNFPEFTGRLCPAPCESACVLGINEPPVTIKQVEVNIVDKAWEHGWITPILPDQISGQRVAIIGSGPAGLTAAQQLTRVGHDVSVFERDDRIGGLLRYGIPSFKMEKRYLDRRLAQMEAEGTQFVPNTSVGTDLPVTDLLQDFDAVVLAVGATQWRDLQIPGRDASGILQAMEYLPQANKVQEGDIEAPPVSAKGKHVVIIGGGDTGADCLGTALRQGASSVQQFEIMPRPPSDRSEATPWPTWPLMHRVSSAHEEGGERIFAVSTQRFVGDDDGHVRNLELSEVEFVDGRFEPVPDSERSIPADAVFLAMGFTGPEQGPLLEQFGLTLTERGSIERTDEYATEIDGVFVAGDAGRGQSLIVWAIAEGRAAAASVDRYLTGDTNLPSPIRASARPLTV